MSTPNLYLMLLSIILHSSHRMAYELIYHTENSHSLQYFDCIYYTTNRIESFERHSVKAKVKQNILGTKYCRQLHQTTPLERPLFSQNSTCFHGGVLVSFAQLKSQNVAATDALKFSSGIERVNKYAIYLSSVTGTDDFDAFICNCTRPGTFGQFCEYEFYYDSSSFNEAVTKQFKSGRETAYASQFHNNRPCYTTLVCNSSLLCLDWRSVCDGKYADIYEMIFLLNIITGSVHCYRDNASQTRVICYKYKIGRREVKISIKGVKFSLRF